MYRPMLGYDWWRKRRCWAHLIPSIVLRVNCRFWCALNTLVFCVWLATRGGGIGRIWYFASFYQVRRFMPANPDHQSGEPCFALPSTPRASLEGISLKLSKRGKPTSNCKYFSRRDSLIDFWLPFLTYFQTLAKPHTHFYYRSRQYNVNINFLFGSASN